MHNMLSGKNILVAGAGGLLGTMLVKEIISQGGTVIAADSNIKATEERLKNTAIKFDNVSLIELDVTNEKCVVEFFNDDVSIDGAVNATYPRNKEYGKHFFDVNLASFNENLSLHLGSAFLFSQQCAAYFLREKRDLSLVNISSIYGVGAPKFDIYKDTEMTMPVEYAAIKSAILNLNKYIVAYINDSRFRINAVSPGGIFDNQPEAFCEAYKKNTHGAGMLSVEKIAGTIVFLLSDSSKHVTGQNIIVDDGFTL